MISNFIQITLWHRCSRVNLLHIFRTTFPKNISGGLLLIIAAIELLEANFTVSMNLQTFSIMIFFCFSQNGYFIGYTGKVGLWTHNLDAWTLDDQTIGLQTTGRLDFGHLYSGRLNSRQLDTWTLELEVSITE